MSDDLVERNRLWARLDQAVDALPEPPSTPVAVVDLDAFDANAADLVRRAGGKPLRVASKSLRVPALIRRALAHDGFSGVLAFTVAEALWLHETGVSDDIVVAYPSVDVAALRRLKLASMAQLEVRRREIAEALSRVTDLEFWNGGGSGSVEATAADATVTEITAGSGLLVPGIFDHCASFEPRPAAYFGLRVTRKPTPTVATVQGGGLIASGATGADRSPVPWAPPGLHLTGLEGAGEVQTPLTGHPAVLLRIGDLVWFRHAKSGELFEHVRDVHLLRGGAVTEVVPSHRGCNRAF